MTGKPLVVFDNLKCSYKTIQKSTSETVWYCDAIRYGEVIYYTEHCLSGETYCGRSKINDRKQNIPLKLIERTRMHRKPTSTHRRMHVTTIPILHLNPRSALEIQFLLIQEVLGLMFTISVCISFVGYLSVRIIIKSHHSHLKNALCFYRWCCYPRLFSFFLHPLTPTNHKIGINYVNSNY